MNQRILALVMLMASAALPLVAQGSNMRFLEFSPSAYFNDKDWELLRTTARDLLNNGKDGQSVTWKNDENGHNGELTVLETFSDFGTTCRRVKVFSDALQVSATRVVNMCRNKEGLWKVLN